MSKNSWMIKRDDILIIWLFFYACELKRMTFGRRNPGIKNVQICVTGRILIQNMVNYIKHALMSKGKLL